MTCMRLIWYSWPVSYATLCVHQVTSSALSNAVFVFREYKFCKRLNKKKIYKQEIWFHKQAIPTDHIKVFNNKCHLKHACTFGDDELLCFFLLFFQWFEEFLMQFAWGSLSGNWVWINNLFLIEFDWLWIAEWNF